tara:strand:+ start:41 stop:580 length:540 start_codon:yes stop_codon:yes gene_type:complete
MLGLYDKMVMDAKSATEDSAARRKMMKHMGEYKESKTPIVVLFRTVPGEPNNCLIMAPKFLPDIYLSSLMRAVESAEGQASDEFGSYLDRQFFPDGVNMLAMLHKDNYIKKQPTENIIVTYGLTTEGRVPLDQLNKLIAKEKGVKLSELAVKDTVTETVEKATVKKETKSDAKKSSKKT